MSQWITVARRRAPKGAYLARKASHVTQQQFIDCAIAFAKTQADPGIDFGSNDAKQFSQFVGRWKQPGGHQPGA